MCKLLPQEPWYAYLLRYVQEQPRVAMAVIGWVAAVWIYLDFKDFLTQQGQILTKIELRIDHIERELEQQKNLPQLHENDN